MNPYFTSLVEALGWALLHCLWQGTALAMILAVLLRAFRNGRASLRYCASAVALAGFVAAFGITFAVCWPPNVPAALRSGSTPNVIPETSPELSAAPSISPSSPLHPEAAKSPVMEMTPVPAHLAPPLPQALGFAASISWRERFRQQLPWAVALWAAGVLFFSGRFLLSWLSVRRWVGRAVPVSDRVWVARFAELASALEISRPVRLLVSTALTAPAVIGWLKPVVLVPAGIFTGLTAGQLEAILTHELAHIRRQDYLVNLLQNLVETLFFFHPAAWWISAQMRREREHCCDDLAAAFSGGAVPYAKALAALEETRAAPALAMSASDGSLVERIRRLLGVPEPRPSSWPFGVLMAGLAAFFFSLSLGQTAHAEPGPVVAAEAADGKYQSYCVYQGDSMRFVFLAPTGFVLSRVGGPESGALSFPKAKRAAAHEIQFAPDPANRDLLVVSPPGNLHFHYDLTRSRVFFVDFDVHGFSPIIHQIPLSLDPVTSPGALTESAAKVVRWLANSDDAQQYEATREQVPEKDYKPGKPLVPSDQSILWAEPNEVGLRLGVSGLAPNAEIAIGQSLPIKQYIRNDGPATLRLSATGIFNEGTDGALIDKAGSRLPLKRGYQGQMFFIRYKLAAGEFVELQSAPLQTILANRDGSPATPQRAYTSSLVVPPGEYTLRLSHHIGEFLGLPGNANVGDPRLAPGLGEWTGTLDAAPIAFRLTAPAVDTAGPGKAIEIEKTYRLQFQKGQIVLSLRANGLTHAATWMVDDSGNWPTPGGTWKTADPSGDYLAAWDEGSTRLWYVDSTGIQRLDFGRQLIDGGHWTMAEATGALANMPDKVRQALKLPARKLTETTGDGPVVRGVSLAGVKSTDDPLSLTEIFQPMIPAPAANDLSGRKHHAKSGIFEMPLSGETEPTLLIVPKERREYYLELRGRVYGPIPGNPAEDLGLAEIIRKKMVGKPNFEGVVLLENLIRHGSEPLRALACRLAAELPESEGPFDYDGIFRAAIDYSIEAEETFTMESGVGLQHVRGLLFSARDRWEKRRVLLPENNYLRAELAPAEQPDVVWGEPDQTGLRLGVSGLTTVKDVAIGKSIPIQIILRNDGPATVWLSWDPVWNGPLHARLVDSAGKEIPVDFKFSGGLTDYRRTRLDPGQQLRLPPTELEFYATQSEVQNAPHKDGFEYNPRFNAPAGSYTLHLDYRVGKPEYADLTISNAAPRKVEWTGVLSMKPLPLTVLAP